jgi:PTH1 family peptidyl-tRNA hydrolase
MKLIVGLGNPGPRYQGTRHNVGFEAIDRLARRCATSPVARQRFQGATLEASIEDQSALLLKPATFMNRSGQSVLEAVQFYKLDPALDLLVIVDDMSLPCGSIRLRAEGSAGSHNGLEDVERRLGSGAWARLRIGIDDPGTIPWETYVLGRFQPQQLELVEGALEDAVAAAASWAAHGITETMNRFNRRKTA